MELDKSAKAVAQRVEDILEEPILESMGNIVSLRGLPANHDRALSLVNEGTERKLMAYLDGVLCGDEERYSPQARKIAWEIKKEYLSGEWHWRIVTAIDFDVLHPWLELAVRQAVKEG